MTLRRAFLRDSELDRSTYPEMRDQVIAFEQDPATHETRSYPGYPKTDLVRCRPRPLAGLEKALASRRCRRRLGREVPSKRELSRLLQFAHGVTGGEGRGPVPSAGGLQSLELYVAAFETSWLPAGVHHYDRAGHHLSRVVEAAVRDRWRELVPAMDLVEGGALLWIVAGRSTATGAGGFCCWRRAI
jgi:hypothetical protein